MKRILALSLAMVLTFSNINLINVVAANNKYNFSQSGSNKTQLTESEQQKIQNRILELLNKDRKARGLGALKINTQLQKAANIRAKEIKTKFSHTRPNGTKCFTVLKEVGYNYKSAGENIYKASALKSDAGLQIYNAWKKSPGHWKNMMNANVNEIGIGLYKSGSYTHATQMLAKR